MAADAQTFTPDAPTFAPDALTVSDATAARLLGIGREAVTFAVGTAVTAAALPATIGRYRIDRRVF